MKKQELSPAEERKIKIAQIGILVAMVLAVALFVGIRVSTHPADEAPVSATVTTSESRWAEASPVADPSADMVAEGVLSEPADLTSAAPGTEDVEEETVVSAPPAHREPVTYAEAEQTFRDGDYEEAAALFSAYVQDHGANAWGHYMLGLSEFRAGDTDAAEDAFLNALELKPDHLKSLVNYARVLITQDRNDEARTRLEMALAVNPASIEAARVLGRVQDNLGQVAESESTYRDILTSRPDDVWALNNLGLVLIQQERFADALAPLARAAALNGTAACIRNNLGIALENTGHLVAAQEAYAQAVDCDAAYAKASANLTRIEGRTDAADLPVLDLAALAESFQARPAAVALAETEIAMIQEEEEEVDMEVASALDSSVTAADQPE